MTIDLPEVLVELRRAILTMAASVEVRLGNAVAGLTRQDVELAGLVRHGDSDIDRMEIDIESECLRILALGHPMAGDLRFVLAVLRINNDLERIADLAKGIAKRTIKLVGRGPITPPQALETMAHSAQTMLSNAVAALADSNATLCRKIRRDDERVDDLQKEIYVWAQDEIPRNVEHTGLAIDILTITHRLERIGDLATNIAEDVVFLIEGRVIRHSPVS